MFTSLIRSSWTVDSSSRSAGTPTGWRCRSATFSVGIAIAIAIGRGQGGGGGSAAGSFDGILMKCRVVVTFQMAAASEPLVASFAVVGLGSTSFGTSSVISSPTRRWSSSRRRIRFPSRRGGFGDGRTIAGT